MGGSSVALGRVKTIELSEAKVDLEKNEIK